MQKQLGVEMVYVDVDARTVFVTDHSFHAKRTPGPQASL